MGNSKEIHEHIKTNTLLVFSNFNNTALKGETIVEQFNICDECKFKNYLKKRNKPFFFDAELLNYLIGENIIQYSYNVCSSINTENTFELTNKYKRVLKIEKVNQNG